MRFALVASGLSLSLVFASCNDNSAEEEQNAGVVNVEKGVASPMWTSDMEKIAPSKPEPATQQVQQEEDDFLPETTPATVAAPAPVPPAVTTQKDTKRETTVEKPASDPQPSANSNKAQKAEDGAELE